MCAFKPRFPLCDLVLSSGSAESPRERRGQEEWWCDEQICCFHMWEEKRDLRGQEKSMLTSASRVTCLMKRVGWVLHWLTVASFSPQMTLIDVLQTIQCLSPLASSQPCLRPLSRLFYFIPQMFFTEREMSFWVRLAWNFVFFNPPICFHWEV